MPCRQDNTRGRATARREGTSGIEKTSRLFRTWIAALQGTWRNNVLQHLIVMERIARRSMFVWKTDKTAVREMKKPRVRRGSFACSFRIHKLVEESDQFLASARLLQFTDGFRFDLPNSFAGHLEYVPHFLQRVAVTVSQSISQLDNFTFAITESL